MACLNRCTVWTRGQPLIVALCGAWLLSLLVSAPVHAQTAEQLRAYQNASPAQRDALMKQVGGNAPVATQAGAANQVLVNRPSDVDDENPSGKIRGGELVLMDLLPLPDASSAGSAGSAGSAEAGMPLRFDARRLMVPLSDAEREVQTKTLQLILAHNPYQLSANGVLQLPGFSPIPLAGLTPDQAHERLALDPNLQRFALQLQILRPSSLDAAGLRLFGYDLFKGSASAFVPGTDIPAPDDYKIGPGDQMSIQLYGQTSTVYNFPITRDGTISLPDLGPIAVGGMSLGAARSQIESRVAKQMIGTQVRVTLGELRTARVLVVGDAMRPGTVVVSGLSTATSALFASGGVRPIGSLRNIEIKRDGALLRRLDLYDVLLKGDTANDVALQTGDVVLVPPIGPTVGIAGEVRRPAIYEIKAEKTVGALLDLAGGVGPEADLKLVTLDRIEPGKERTSVRLNLTTVEGRAFVLRSGDVLRIPQISPVVSNSILVEGHVYHPGNFAYQPGIRLSDILSSRDELKPRADLHYVLVRREEIASGRVTVFSADLEAALAHRGEAADLLLMPRDKINVFDVVSPRDRIVSPLLDELQTQSSPTAFALAVDISGFVNAPGRYPLEPGMRVLDVIRAGGGLKDQAYTASAELSRYAIGSGKQREASLIAVDLAAALRGEASANLELSPYDLLTIKETPDWGRVEDVELVGEVKFPGIYRVRRGETLASVMKRAGGLNSNAFARGAVFMREELKTREKESIDKMADRLQAQMNGATITAANSVTAASSNTAGKDAAATLAISQSLISQLRATKPVGRLVIDLPALIARGEGSDADVTLRPGDKLVIPRETQEVIVLGEVQNPTSHLFRRGMNKDMAIALSGGYATGADKKRSYVMHADGSVALFAGRWSRGGNVPVLAGDTVVVPLDTERLPPLVEWQSISSILYNFAVAASSLKTFGVL